MTEGESTRWNPERSEVETYRKTNVLTMQVAYKLLLVRLI